MTRTHPRLPALAGLTAMGATLTLAACGSSAPPAAAAGGQASPSVAAASSPASPAAAQSPVATTAVAITNFSFSPAVVTVKAGATVTWTNQDEEAHIVAFTGSPASSPLQNGDAYTHTFDRAGSYSYVCTIHPFMHGMVVVTAG